MDLRLIQDHLEITQVIQKVGRAFDEKRHDALLPTLFTEDASIRYLLSGQQMDFSPPAGFAVFKHFHERCFWTQHLIAPSVIEVMGDTARASSPVQAIHIQIREDGSRNTWIVGACYFDELVRRADGWRIARRTVPAPHDQGAFEEHGVRLFPALPDLVGQG